MSATSDISREKVEFLMKGFGKQFRNVLKADTGEDYSAFTSTIVSDGFAEDYAWLGSIPDLREWIGERVVNQLQSSTYTLRNRKFEGTLGVKVDDIRDDRTGQYASRVNLLADAAKRWRANIVIEALTKNAICADGQNFFDTDHVHDKAGTAFSNDNPGGGSAGTYIYLMDTSKALKPIIFQSREEPVITSITNPESDHVFKNAEFLFGTECRGESGYSFWQLAMRVKPATSVTVANVRTVLKASRILGNSIKNEDGQKLGIRYDTIVCDVGSEEIVRQAVESIYEDSNFTLNTLKGMKIVVPTRL